MSELRCLPVPNGLEGERVDSAVARMFGLTRSQAADLALAGAIRLDGNPAGKSTRVQADLFLEVELPDPPAVEQVVPEVVPEVVQGMGIVHDDPDVVVVDNPVGGAAHPSPGRSGRPVSGGLAAAGFGVPTGGGAGRQGLVH